MLLSSPDRKITTLSGTSCRMALASAAESAFSSSKMYQGLRCLLIRRSRGTIRLPMTRSPIPIKAVRIPMLQRAKSSPMILPPTVTGVTSP